MAIARLAASPRPAPALRWLIAIGAFTGALASGCTKPKPPPTDAPPEPQAAGLRDAVQTPLERARGVEATVQDAATAQRAAIDAAGG